MKKLKVILFSIALLTLGLSTVEAQQTAIYSHDLEEFDRAMTLYRQKLYKPAQLLFKEVKQKASEEQTEAQCSFYIANCAVRLGQRNADELMEDFVQNYPSSPKRNSAYASVADYYFRLGQFSQARKWYKKVDQSGMSRSKQEEFYFNNGYAAFKTGRKKVAKKFFNRVRDSREYGADAKYYLGFIAYEGDNYNEAKDYFKEVGGDRNNRRNLNYFQSDMNFSQGNFKKAIELGKKQLQKSNRRQRSELNKIIGESYFNLGQYKEAIPYLKEYKGQRGKLNNTDYYQIGYAYYKQNQFQKAVDEFNKIIGGQNQVAQNAYYHLAESYIELGKKQQALNAFKNASEMDFNSKITEDAALNYAKLSYEIGNNYKSVPEVLTDFVKKYPDSEQRESIKELLVNSYVSSKNYKKALELLSESNEYEDKVAYQKVAYFRGLELFKANKFQKALDMFDNSLTERNSQEIMAKATFWKAESQFNLKNFQEALIGYKEFKGMPVAQNLTEYKDIDYNIAYAYFKKRDYQNAKNSYKSYSQKSKIDPVQKNDALLRLGDSYFATSDYWPAMEAYNKAIKMKGIDSDYAYFQKAISYSFVGRNQRKIEDLNDFLSRYKKSIYRDDAFYELGNTFVAEEQNKDAVEAYSTLIQEFPNSAYVSKAMLKKGLIFYNTGRGNQALKTFKDVVAQFPSTDEASEAVKNARTVFVDLGRTDEYAQWVNQLDFINVSDSDIDNASYESAEKKFINNQPDAAVKGFEKYLNKFPNGRHALSSNFYLAQLYFQKGKQEESIPHYEFVIDKSRSEFTEQSLARLSQVYLEKTNYNKAVPVLQRLEKEADFPQNITFAQTNLMKAYYRQKKYAQSISKAETVLADEKVSDEVKSDAHVFIARSAIKTGNEDRAEKAYKEVEKIADGKLGAEAKYYEAYFKRKAKKYKASNAAVQELAKDYSGYKKFGAKGLLLMAKNFYNLEDAYQATYILENVIKNFGQFPEIVQKAKAEQKRIKTKEAKTNSSVDAEQTENTDQN
jgi:tetratricopeptide (TPR) repeat protein